jgi:hypothetical protein
MLKAIGLIISNVEYTPSEYKDLVSDIKYQGRSILAGTRIPEGSNLVLVVGSGLGEGRMNVPALKGLDLEQGRQEALYASFVIGAVNYDKTPSGNESDYVIYRQRPSAGRTHPAGTRIDIWLSTDRNMLNKVFEEDKEPTETDEQFF